MVSNLIAFTNTSQHTWLDLKYYRISYEILPLYLSLFVYTCYLNHECTALSYLVQLYLTTTYIYVHNYIEALRVTSLIAFHRKSAIFEGNVCTVLLLKHCIMVLTWRFLHVTCTSITSLCNRVTWRNNRSPSPSPTVLVQVATVALALALALAVR